MRCIQQQSTNARRGRALRLSGYAQVEDVECTKGDNDLLPESRGCCAVSVATKVSPRRTSSPSSPCRACTLCLILSLHTRSLEMLRPCPTQSRSGDRSRSVSATSRRRCFSRQLAAQSVYIGLLAPPKHSLSYHFLTSSLPHFTLILLTLNSSPAAHRIHYFSS